MANFVAKKDLLLALPDAIPGLDKESRDDARSYLEEFYSSIKTTEGRAAALRGVHGQVDDVGGGPFSIHSRHHEPG